jgi:hypothetical protein
VVALYQGRHKALPLHFWIPVFAGMTFSLIYEQTSIHPRINSETSNIITNPEKQKGLQLCSPLINALLIFIFLAVNTFSPTLTLHKLPLSRP